MSELLNLIGLSTGVVLYAMLLAMVVRSDRHSAATPRRVDPLLVATAVLGLVWNVCALPAYELPKIGVRGILPIADRDRRGRPGLSAGGRGAVGAAR